MLVMHNPVRAERMHRVRASGRTRKKTRKRMKKR